MQRITDIEDQNQHQERRQELIERVATVITEQFQAQGVEVLRQIPVCENRTLDIFVRFPSKEFFAISVKSPGIGKVVYNENNQILYFGRKNRSLDKYDRPDVLTELKETELWLRKNRRDLFGKSANDAKRKIIKILTFLQPSQINKHNNNLYAKINDQRFLCTPREKAAVFVLSEDQIVDFIKFQVTCI